MSTEIVSSRFGQTIELPLDKIKPFQGDLKSLSKESYHKFRSQLLDNGFAAPFIVWDDSKGNYWCIDGHQRLQTLKMMKADGVIIPDRFPANVIHAEDEQRAKKILLGMVSQYGKLSDESVSGFLCDSGITLEWVEANIDLPYACGLITDMTTSVDDSSSEQINLSDRFLIPPFSVLNAREGWWQERKRKWINIGIKSELGRGEINNGGGTWDNLRCDGYPTGKISAISDQRENR